MEATTAVFADSKHVAVGTISGAINVFALDGALQYTLETRGRYYKFDIGTSLQFATLQVIPLWLVPVRKDKSLSSMPLFTNLHTLWQVSNI